MKPGLRKRVRNFAKGFGLVTGFAAAVGSLSASLGLKTPEKRIPIQRPPMVRPLEQRSVIRPVRPIEQIVIGRQVTQRQRVERKPQGARRQLDSVVSRILPQERINISAFFLKKYQNLGRRLLDSGPDFKKLVTINAGNTISWYGRGKNDLRLRKVVPELAFTVEKLAKAYMEKFGESLPCGGGWDYKGHSSTSAHYCGLAIDIDVGPNIGTSAYKRWARQRFKWIAEYLSRNHSRVRVIFGGRVANNVIVLPGHGNHMHLDLKPRR